MSRFRVRAVGAGGERGATVVVVAMVGVLLLVFVALAVDISSLVNDKHELHDSLDTAAHAGAYKLPNDPAGAKADALAFAQNNFPDAPVPTVDLWCIVGALPGPVVDPSHIPETCDPGPAPYDVANYPGLRCNSSICAIPCSGDPGTACNTIRVANQKDVPYAFAPVIGIDDGSTGVLVSAACRGACGKPADDPIDIVVVADRTSSMSGYYGTLGAGINALLSTLTPSVHSVALGTISMSSTTAPAACPTSPNPSVIAGSLWDPTGTWIPVGLSSDYQTTPATDPVTLDTNSALVKGVDCISAGDSSSTGTWLAAPMAAAHQYLIANGRPGSKKVIIFETDGEPNETDVSVAPFGSSIGDIACTNAQSAASNAKDAGIFVITVAFRLQGTRCDGTTSGGSATVTSVLASMASADADGVPSADDGGGAGSDCDTPAKVSGENADGEYFFCTSDTPSSSDLEAIFETAAQQIDSSVKLVRLP